MQPFKIYSESCGSVCTKKAGRRESQERENTKYLGAIGK